MNRPRRRQTLRAAGVLGLGAVMMPAIGLAQSGVGNSQPAGIGRPPERPAPALGSLIETPRTTLLDGSVREAGAWRGKLLVIELWATWCPFCRKQNPLLDRLHRTQAARGLEVLALSIDEQADAVKRYIAETGYGFSVARFDAAWAATLGRPKGLPIIWVVGRDSRLLQVEIGELFPEDIELLERWL